MTMWIKNILKLFGTSLLICAAVAVLVGVAAALRLPYDTGSFLTLDFISSIGLIPFTFGMLVAVIVASDHFSKRIIGARVAIGASRACIFRELWLGGLVLSILPTILCVLTCHAIMIARVSESRGVEGEAQLLCDFAPCVLPFVALVSMSMASMLVVRDAGRTALLVLTEQLSLVAIMMTMAQGDACNSLFEIHPMMFMRMLAEGTLQPVDIAIGECASMCWALLFLCLGWISFRRCELR